MVIHSSSTITNVAAQGSRFTEGSEEMMLMVD